MAEMPSNSNPQSRSPHPPWGSAHDTSDSQGSDTTQSMGNSHGNGFQGNGGASGLNTESGQDGMEGWAEWQEEQDNSATDYYALLNVPRDATSSQIRSSYHALSLRFHPDKQPAHQRDRTTLHFNNIQVAYETLINPHKRTIYDTLGVEGLRQKAFEIGVKSMSPEEFKAWLQEQVQKQKVEEVMSLINSRGDITISLDVSGLRFQEAVEIPGANGIRILQFREMQPVRLTKYFARHSFTVPLEGLGEILTTPFPSFKQPAEKIESQKVSKNAIPSLTVTAFLGGVPVQTKNNQQAYFASPGLSARLAHSFPSLPPDSPLSIASVLAGLDLEATSTIFPQRVVSASVSKSFGASRLIIKPIFNSSPLLVPPVVEATYASSVGKRGSFFIQYNSGAVSQWPSALSQLLSGPPLTSHLTIGHTIMPIADIPIVDDDGDDENLHTKRPSRSKATETWRITATAGFFIGGGQLGLSWGRTYFIGTPIGPPPSLDPTPKTASNPRKEGIKMNVDTTIGLSGGMTINARASRKIFTHTRMGVGISIGGNGGKNGVVFSISWSRLGQKIAIPIAIAPIPETTSILYGTLVPFIGYALLEGIYLRPRQYKLRRKEIEKKKRQVIVKVAKSRKKAGEIVELMREYVELNQQRRKEGGGLVILEAGYGVKGKAGEWADVTIALAGLIEDEQVVIPRGLDKSHIHGFYDPAPYEKKELWVKYLFKGKKHEITVGNSRGLVIPVRAHSIE